MPFQSLKHLLFHVDHCCELSRKEVNADSIFNPNFINKAKRLSCPKSPEDVFLISERVLGLCLKWHKAKWMERGLLCASENLFHPVSYHGEGEAAKWVLEEVGRCANREAGNEKAGSLGHGEISDLGPASLDGADAGLHTDISVSQ
jgi:hypothetical protein